MQQALRPVPTETVPAPAILAADVGGTHARVGLLDIHPGTTPLVTLTDCQTYDCAKWPGLTEILEAFLMEHHCDRDRIVGGSLAIAGYLRDDVLVARNLRWPVRLSSLRERLGLERIDIVNDFEALAHATRFVTRSNSTTVLDAAGVEGPVAVIGPGTGLGTAVLLPDHRDGFNVIPSEAGQAALAPGTAREIAVLHHLSRGRDYICAEHVLSGPGLLNLYHALADVGGMRSVYTEPEQITVAAVQGNDTLARDTLATFCALLGSFAGDLAVIFKASGGVVLAGGILPSIRDFLLASDFRERFLNKGVMRDFLASVPVRLVDQGQLGVIGAATMGANARSRTLRDDLPWQGLASGYHE